MSTFKAYLLEETDGAVAGRLTRMRLDDLDAGGTLVRVEYSSINYKDALAGTGKGAIARRLPLIGGIDLAGRVIDSDVHAEGSEVLVCGCGLSETRHGGFAEYARVPSDCVVPIPDGLDARSSMAIGTAGFTAALALDRLEQAGLAPTAGPVAVTGATGGVGSVAIELLAGRGYAVTAITGKTEDAAYLETLGAAEVLARTALPDDPKPLGKARWAAVVDNVGGAMLAALLKSVLPDGLVASIGLAGGAKLETTVLPFILRGVSLLGINSVFVAPDRRARIWGRLATDLKPRHLDAIVTHEVTLEDMPAQLEAYIAGSVRGRTIVRLGA
jgi:acrylyl-CoA reductase (NADPH)